MKRVNQIRFPFCTHRFVLTGLNLERFINTMRKEEIPLVSVRRQNQRSLICQCFSADLGQIASIADEKGWRMHRVEPAGLSALWAFLKKRPGIPCGLALALIIALTLSQFIWRVEIHNAGAYEAEIASYLAQNGYAIGARRAGIDASVLERELTYRYPEIAWLHAYVSNVTLVVDVTHGVPMPNMPEKEPAHLYASRGGVVDSIRVSAGTAAVKVGDVVQKGQLLIRGEERGKDGETAPVRAQGTVMARCWQSHTVTLPVHDIISTETGRSVQETRIHTPWFSFPEKWQGADYLAYNTYMTQLPVVGSFFPISFQRIIHCEVEMEYRRRDMDEVREEAADAALKHLKTALYGYEIIDKWVDYCMIEDESLSASVTAEWLMDIGETISP